MGAALGGCDAPRKTERLGAIVPSPARPEHEQEASKAILLKERFTAHPEKTLEVVLVLAEGARAVQATPALGDVARRLGEAWATRGQDVIIHLLAPVTLTPAGPRIRPHVLSLTPAEASALSLGKERRNLEHYVDLSATAQLEVLVVGEDEILARDLQDVAEATRTEIEERYQGFALTQTPLENSPLAVQVDGRSVDPAQYYVDREAKLLRFHPDFGLSQGARIEVAYYALPRKS